MTIQEPLELARKWRPRTFGDMAGQVEAAALLFRISKRRKLPGAMLFYGASGCGKTTMARMVAMAANCTAVPGKADAWPCGSCPPCKAIAAGSASYVEEVDAASFGTIDEVRRLRDRANYGTGGEVLVIILDEAHQLSGPAAEALLAVTEEQNTAVIWILCTTAPHKLSAPLRGRCSPYRFSPLPAPVIAARLAHICAAEGFPAEPELLAAIAEAARGGMRAAITELDKLASAGVWSLPAWRRMTGIADYAPALLEAAADGDHTRMYLVQDAAVAGAGSPAKVASEVIRCLRDVLVLQTPGGAVAAADGALEARQALARSLGKPAVVRAVRVLWALRKAGLAEDPEADLSLAMAMVCEALCPGGGRTIGPGGHEDSIREFKEALEVLWSDPPPSTRRASRTGCGTGSPGTGRSTSAPTAARPSRCCASGSPR